MTANNFRSKNTLVPHRYLTYYCGHFCTREFWSRGTVPPTEIPQIVAEYRRHVQGIQVSHSKPSYPLITGDDQGAVQTSPGFFFHTQLVSGALAGGIPCVLLLFLMYGVQMGVPITLAVTCGEILCRSSDSPSWAKCISQCIFQQARTESISAKVNFSEWGNKLCNCIVNLVR